MKLAVVGIGAMGLPMALRLRDRGHTVVVHDIDHGRHALAEGCSAVASAAAAAAGAQALIVAVVDAAQTAEVLFGAGGAAAALAPGMAVLLCPTIGPADTEQLAQRLTTQGLAAIDAPMSGGPLRARDGSMSLMVACSDEAFERWQTLLQDLSTRLFRVGTRPGDGARTKLVNNLLAAINLAGAAEALALAERLGLDAATTLAVIEQSSGQSWIGSDRLRRALAGDATVNALMTLLAKDSGLALQAAQQAGFSPALGQEAAAAFAAAVQQGYARADDSALWAWRAQRSE